MASAAPAPGLRPNPSLPLPQGRPPVKHPTDHAILVGIQHYRPGIRSLRGSINDCRLFSEWLIDPDGGGLDPANIRFYGSVDPTDGCPFGNQIADLIFELQNRRLDGLPPGRRLYLFFSGHGVAPPNFSDDCGLVMANAMPGVMRAFLGGKIATELRRSGWFEEVVLIMDCCREVAGNVIDESGLPPFADPTLGEKPFFHIMAAGWGATTSERELPHPLDPTQPSLHHGVLTHALLTALQCARDEQGNVSAETLSLLIPHLVQSLTGDRSKEPLIDFRPRAAPIIFGQSRGLALTITLRPGTAAFRLMRGTELADVTSEGERQGNSVRFRVPAGLHLIERLDADGAVVGSKIRNILHGGEDVAV